MGVGGFVAEKAASMVKVDTQCRVLGEDVADLSFELGVKGSAAEAELVVVVLRMLIFTATPEAAQLRIEKAEEKKGGKS